MRETEHIHITRPGSIRKMDGILRDSELGEVAIQPDSGGMQAYFFDPEGRELPLRVHLHLYKVGRDVGGEIRDSFLRSINYHLNN